MERAQTLLDADNVAAGEGRTEPAAIGELVLSLYLKNIVEISIGPPRFRTVVSERPRASRLARLQAAEGMVVTNLRHQRVQLGALDHELLRHLDGHRDRSALAALLEEALSSGGLTITNDTGPFPAESRTPELVGEILDQGLASLARQALLVA